MSNGVSKLFNYEQEGEQEVGSTGGDDEPPEDEHKFEKTYIALDGVTADEITDEDIDSIETKLRHFTVMELGLPVQNVRVVSADKNIVELASSKCQTKKN